MKIADRLKSLAFSGSKSFSRNVLILMTGTIIAQAIPLAVSPLLARLFSPEQFGLFALYFSISQIFAVFVTGRYESAIILPDEEDDAVNLLALSISITIAVTLILVLLVFAARFVLADILHKAGLYKLILLMPLTVLSIGFYNTFNLWLNRTGKFSDISTGKILRSAFSSGFSIAFGLTVLKTGGLIVADTIGQFCAGVFVLGRSLKEGSAKILSFRKDRMKAMAIRYKHFPKFNVVSGLFEKGAGQMPVILLSGFFGQAVTGFFSLSQRIIAAPGSLIGVSVGDVFRRHASAEFSEKGNCHETFMKLFRILLLISVVPFVLLFAFSPAVFAFIFGEEWRIAGEYTRIMTVMYFLSFVVSPLSNMFIIAEKQNIDLVIQIFLFAFVTISFIAGHSIFGDPASAILLFSITYSVKYCIEFWLSYRFSKGRKPDINTPQTTQ